MKRTINWLDHATRTLHSNHRQAAGCADYISQRLANLLLERLPSPTALELIEILPDSAREMVDSLRAAADSPSEASIGYQDFLNRTAFAIGCSGCISSPADSQNFEPELNELAKKVTDTFLWACARELPNELKFRMAEGLPLELKSRMDLFEDPGERTQVA